MSSSGENTGGPPSAQKEEEKKTNYFNYVLIILVLVVVYLMYMMEQRQTPLWVNTMSSPKRFVFFELFIFLMLLILFNHIDPFGVTEKFPASVNLFLLSTVFMMVVAYYYVKEKPNLKDPSKAPGFKKVFEKAGALLGVTVGAVVAIIALFWLLRNFPSLTELTKWGLNGLIIAGALGVLYLLLRPIADGETRNVYLSFLKNLVLYVPCLVIQFADWIKYQWNITTNTVWIVLGLEIVLIALRFLLPYIFNKLVTHDGTHLLQKPVYLDRKHTLGTFENMHATSDPADQSPFKYHYAISAWFSLNPQPYSTRSAYTRYTDIINYANKPRVQFNSMKNTLRVQAENQGGEFIDIYVKEGTPFQRWNNIVINYDGGNMDVFLNGELVASKPNILPYMSYENVDVGADKGLEGGICNVVYYKRVLTQGDIQLGYKLLSQLTPPVL